VWVRREEIFERERDGDPDVQLWEEYVVWQRVRPPMSPEACKNFDPEFVAVPRAYDVSEPLGSLRSGVAQSGPEETSECEVA